MSGSGEIYSETSSEILASILRKINQQLVYAESLNNPISDTEQLSIGRTVDSETQTNDQMSAGLSRQESDQFYMPLEPYPNLKTWLKFDSGITVKDYAYQGTICKTETVKNEYSQIVKRPLKRTIADDATTEGPVYSITNGLNQFFRIENSQHLKIQNVLSTANIYQISMIVSPMFYYTPEVGTDWADAVSYIDNEQADNGVRISISGDGKIRFRILWNNQPYEVETAADSIARLYITPFQTNFFQSTVFQTEAPDSPQQNPDLDPLDWTQLTFVFNKVSRQMTIKKTDILGVSTVLATSADETGIHNTFAMHLPLNEGNGTVLHDVSGNTNNGTSGAAPDNDITWTLDDEGGLGNMVMRLDTDTARVTIPNHTTINTLSVFTIAFKIKLQSYAATADVDIIMGKNVAANGSGLSAAGGFMFYMAGSGSKTLGFKGLTNSSVNVNPWLPNAIPLLDTWYNVILTYDGANYNLEVVGVGATSPWSGSSHVYTNSSDTVLGHVAHCAHVEIADVIIDKGTAWGSTQKTWFTSKVAADKKGFPVYYPPPPAPNDDPVIITAPWTKLYNVDPVTGSTKALKINSPTAASPFVPVFTVPAGSDITDTEVEKYNVPDGTQGGSTTNPWYTAYTLTPQSSTGQLDYNETAAGEIVRTTGSNIYNRKLTEIGVYLKADSGGAPEGGTIYLAIIKADGINYITFGAGISPASLTSSWVLFTRQNFTAQYAVQVGDAVGIIWVGGTDGTVDIQRGGSTYYEDSDLSCQGHLYDGDWHENPSYAIAGLFRYGGETVTGANPFYKMGSTNYVVGIYQLNSTIEGILATRVIWRVRRVGSASAATIRCAILNNAGTVLGYLGGTYTFDSISTSVQDLEFILRTNTIAWADTYKLALFFVVKTGIDNTTNYLEVNFNVGPAAAGYVGGTALRAQVYNGVNAYVDVSPVSDWAGKVYTGGNSFTAYRKLGDGHTTQIGICVNDATAMTAAKKFSKFDVTMKSFGLPTGPIVMKIFQKVGANYELRATFNTILAESLTTTAATYTFTFVLNGYQTSLNDLIAIEYTGGDATNYVLVNTNTNTAAGAGADGTKSILYELKDGLYTFITDQDLGVTAYTGGVPDLVSRSKRAFVCNNEEAPIRAKRITSAKFFARRVGTIAGLMKLTVVRGSDYTTVKTMHTWDASVIPVAPTWTQYYWDDIDNTHFMGLSDKIAVEFEGGDQNNYIEIQYVDHLAGEGDYKEDMSVGDYDGISWHNDETKYLAGDMWTGGYTYIQDPSIPPIPDPNHYDHDWFIGAGGFIAPENEVPTTYYGMRIRDFRIIDEEYTLDQLTSIMVNKFTAADILAGQVGICGYSNADETDE